MSEGLNRNTVLYVGKGPFLFKSEAWVRGVRVPKIY